MEPQAPASVLPHCTVQFTPPGGTSFATTALTPACEFAATLAGGGVRNEIVGGTAATVIAARPGFPAAAELADAFGVALTRTSPPAGIADGAL
jgi:hypothetical protein